MRRDFGHGVFTFVRISRNTCLRVDRVTDANLNRAWRNADNLHNRYDRKRAWLSLNETIEVAHGINLSCSNRTRIGAPLPDSFRFPLQAELRDVNASSERPNP